MGLVFLAIVAFLYVLMGENNVSGDNEAPRRGKETPRKHVLQKMN